MFSTRVNQFARASIALSIALPSVLFAQRTERFNLSGPRVAVYNIAGKVAIESGSGSDVVVEVTRAGKDAARLKMDQKTVNGHTALCIVYPDERIIYRDVSRGNNSNFRTNTSSDGECQGGGRKFLGGNRIEVRSQGDGVEAWADVRILVPAGKSVKVWEVVGNVDAVNVDGMLSIDVSSAAVTTRGTKGSLSVDAGSANVSVAAHRGDLSVDVGSGNVTLSDVEGKAVTIDAGSGGLRGTNVNADDFSLDTGSGTIDFGGISTRRMKVDTGSGGARLGFTTNMESLNVDTGSGSVTLEVPSTFGAQLDITTGSGGVTSDFPVSGRRGDKNEMRGTIGNGRAKVTVETGSGGVRIIRGGKAA